MELSLILGIALLTLIYFKLLKRDSRVSKILQDIPGPPPLPIFGNALTLAVPHTEILQTTRSLVKKYGSAVRLWLFNIPYVLLASGKNVETIMSSTVHIGRTRDYDVMRPWLGNALGLSGGEHWATRRKFLTPAFTFGLQDEFLQVFNEQGEIMKKVVENECVDKGVVNLYPYCFRYSLDVICGKFRLAFLDLLLQSQIKKDATTVLSDEEIRNETDLFMAAGHDTSGSALAWTLFVLAHHPEIQKRVQAEQDDIFGDDRDRAITNEDMTKMQYLEMCFKESLRLRPPIPVIFRQLYEDVSLPDGKVLPAGTSVAISIVDIHLDPEVWGPNPERFDPERFSPENCQGRNSYAWIPFAAGPRSCLGQRFAKIQAKFILSAMLRNFWFEPAESWEEVQIVPDVNLRPVNGLHFKVTKRNKENLKS